MFNFRSRLSLRAPLAAFVLCAVLAAALVWHLDQGARAERRALATNQASARAAMLQRVFDRGLSACYALAALVREGHGAVANFNEVASEMLPFYQGVSELALAPGGVIRDVVPLAGNEKAVGLDLLGNPEQRKETLLARDTRKPVLAGPLELVQGGTGIVVRFPVFLEDAGGKPAFWGYALVVMRLEDVLKAVDLGELRREGYAYTLWRTNPNTGKRQIIDASAGPEAVDPVEASLNVSNAAWVLGVAPVDGWRDAKAFWFQSALGLLFSVLFAYLVKLLLELRAHWAELEATVAQRTAELREREARYRELFEANPQPMWVYDLETLKFLAVNQAAIAHYGYSREEFLAMSTPEVRPPEEIPRLQQRIARLRVANIPDGGVWRHRKKDGTLIDVEVKSHTLDFYGRRAQIVHVNDVTERLRAEAALRESEARFRSLTAMSTDFYWESDAEHRLTQLELGNKEDPAKILPGGSPLGKPRWDVAYLTPDAAGWEAHRAALDAHLPFRDFEYSRMANDGRPRHILISGDPVFDASGGFRGYRGVGKDISERKAAEAKLARMTQLYAALSQCNQAIVRCSSEDVLFPQICREVVEFGGMKAARIRMLDRATGQVRVVASYGRGEEELGGVEVTIDPDSPFGRGPTGTAMREDRPVWCQDYLNDPSMAPWRELGARMGWGSLASLPLRRGGSVVGVFSLLEEQTNAFDEAKRDLLIEMANDISFAMESFDREARRRQAEEALRESEARFRSLTDMSSDFYWESDAEHRLTRRSTSSRANLLVYDDWQGRRRWEIPYLAPDAAAWEAHRAVLDAHQPFRNFEFSRHGIDGSERYISISGDPMFGAAGEFCGYRGVGTDITERKAAERALAESEARFRSLTEMSSDFYWESDADHRLTTRGSADKKVSTVSIFERGAQIGERRWEIPYLTPDAAGWEAHKAVLDAHLPFRNFELSRLGSDGTERFIAISGDPVFDAAGNFRGYRGVGADITERKRAQLALQESEQRLRLAMNSASMAAWEWDIASDVLTWSDDPGWLLGPEPAGGYPDFRELVHPEDRAGFLETGQQAITQGAHYHAVFRIVRTDAVVRWIEAEGVFFPAVGGHKGERVIGVSRDVTESKARQDELRRLNDELEQRVAERTRALADANAELEAFSYSVSHDLRAPLRAIHGFSALLIEHCAGRIDDEGHEMLRRVEAGAEKMARLIDDLLKLSGVSRQEMHIERVDLSALAREAAEELRAAEPQRRVEWVIAPDVSAQGDPGLLRVVLQNLIGNAWKYSARRERARIEFGVDAKDGNPCYFVRDNGVGFDMAHADRLFGPFQRLHTEAEFPGSGIGLATVARILQRHGGKAWAQARAGTGATFYFSLDRGDRGGERVA